MKKILFMLFAAMFSFSGCSSDDDNSENPDMIGKWVKMEVSAKDANIEKKGSYDYIYVPTDGSSFTLQVNNYKNWWISSISTQLTPTSDFKLVYYPNHNKTTSDKNWYDFSAKDNQVKCSILKNTSSETRTIELSMTAGDIFETIYIVQAGK